MVHFVAAAERTAARTASSDSLGNIPGTPTSKGQTDVFGGLYKEEVVFDMGHPLNNLVGMSSCA